MEKRRTIGYMVCIIVGAVLSGTLGFFCCLTYLVSGIVVVSVLRLFVRKIEYGEAFSLGLAAGGLGAFLHYRILMFTYGVMDAGSLFGVQDMALRWGAATLVFFGAVSTVGSALLGAALFERVEKRKAESEETANL